MPTPLHTGVKSPGVSVTEAAKILGYSMEAVRKKAQSGELVAEKIGREWRIMLPGKTTDGTTKILGNDTRNRTEDNHYVEQLVTSLQSEIAFLRQLVTQQQEQIQELSRRTLEQPAIPTPTPAPAPQPARAPRPSSLRTDIRRAAQWFEQNRPWWLSPTRS